MIVMSLLFRMKLVVVVAMMFMMIVMAMIIVHDEGDSLTHFDQPLQVYDCTHFHVSFKLLLWRIFLQILYIFMLFF
jgi:hypothetical protein